MTVKSYLLAGCLATAISAGLADSNENGPIRPVMRKGICSEILNEYECAQAIEKVQLRGSPRARRTDKGLCFDLPKDSEVCIADEEEPYALYYSYLGSFDEPNYHVLAVHFNEGSAVKLVHGKTGEATFVDDVPVPSPGGRFLAIASLDLQAHYNENRLILWDAEGDSLRKIWSMEPRDWGPGIPTWLDGHTIEVPRFEVEEHQLVEKGTLRLTHADGKWKMKKR